MKDTFTFFSFVFISTSFLFVSCKENRPLQTGTGSAVYLESWDTLEKDGIVFIRIKASNGVEASFIPE